MIAIMNVLVGRVGKSGSVAMFLFEDRNLFDGTFPLDKMSAFYDHERLRVTILAFYIVASTRARG